MHFSPSRLTRSSSLLLLDFITPIIGWKYQYETNNRTFFSCVLSYPPPNAQNNPAAPYFGSQQAVYFATVWKNRQRYIMCCHTAVGPRSSYKGRRSQWPRGLRRRSAVARLLKLWVRITPGAWMSLCCECCVLSVRGLCDELITLSEESYRLWYVVVCDLETSWMRRALTHWGLSRQKQFIEVAPVIN
jgi:hypothetical protein